MRTLLINVGVFMLAIAIGVALAQLPSLLRRVPKIDPARPTAVLTQEALELVGWLDDMSDCLRGAPAIAHEIEQRRALLILALETEED